MHRRLVRQAQEHQIESVDGSEIELGEDEIAVGGGERRVQVGGTPSRHRITGGHCDVEVGVTGDQPQQFGAGVAGCADDSDPQPGPVVRRVPHERMIIQTRA